MSHVDQGPLASYNSLADGHLAGYFTNTRMRRHLRKAGLVNKYGEIVTENTYRLNMSRKEHKQHVKDMLAQAIVHKTLDLERTRQAEIRRKLEEIAKIELVRRVRSSRQSRREADILPYISPRSSSSRPSSGPEPHPPSDGGRRGGRARPSRKCRPLSGRPASRKKRPVSALSSNYDDDGEGDVVYLDDEGRPITPAHVDESQLRYASRDPIDTRHLYSLDTAALRKYAALMAKMEQGRGGTSPYLTPQVPLPPKSPRSSRAASARRTPRSAQRYRGEAGKSASPKRPSTANQAYLHPASGGQKFKGQQESLCQVMMVYHGSSLSLSRELLPGRSRQDVVVEQQHCGGNTLTVFKDSLEKGAKFSFISYRHRGYPFSLSIYIDGKMDCRVSTCCEYRHQKGGRIGGRKGHFSISGIQGAVPCYKCQVEKGIRVGNQAPRPKLKRPPEHQEEVVVVETAREPEPPKAEPEPEASTKPRKEQILVPVEDADNDQKANEKYDDDFDSSESSSAEEEDGALSFQPKEARGVDKTTGKVDINELTSDEEEEKQGKSDIGPQLFASRKAKGGKKRKSAGSSSSSSSSSDSEDEPTARGQAQAKVVTIRAENAKMGQTATKPVVKASPEAAHGTKAGNSGGKGGNTVNNLTELSYQKADAVVVEAKKEDISEKKKDEGDSGDDKKKKTDERKRRDSSSSSSSSSSASSKGSTRDYSDTEKDFDGKEGDGKLKEEADERTYEIEEDKARTEKTAVVITPEVTMSEEKDGGKDKEEEEKVVTIKGESTSGEEEVVKAPQAAAVVEVKDAGNEGEVLVKAEEEKIESPSSVTPALAAEVTTSVPEQEVENKEAKRRNSGASTVSSSSVSSSSSSGSASIRDKGPNTVNDPTVVAPPSPTAQTKENNDTQGSEATVVLETKAEVAVEQTVTVKTEPPQEPENKKNKEDSGSEDSDSDSSSSNSDNEEEKDETKDKLSNVEQSKSTDVLALLASKVEEEKKEDEERMRVKLAEEKERNRVEEERENMKRKLEEERERRRKLIEEQERKATSVPAVTITEQTSGGSGSDSSSDSSSDSDNDEGDDKKEKSGMIKTEADVHSKQLATNETTESDGEAMHGGSDPDNVANTTEGSSPPLPGPPAPLVPDVRPGSILPLLEKSRSMVEIKGVTLNKSQLYECAAHLAKQSRISQVNLVNCGLDDDDIQKVVEALKSSPSDPVLLNLSLNPLSSACVDYLLDLLVAKPSIEAVLLQGTRLGDAGVESLIGGLLRQHEDKKSKRSSSREQLKELRELDLSDCKISDDGARAIARLVSSDMEVDTLTLSSNQAVSEHGWKLIGDALASNTTLETLTLDHNLLGDQGVKFIAAGLENNTSVTALDLNGVGVTEVGGRVLVQLLKKNTTLLEITLSENSSLGKHVVDDIGKYIALNKTMGGSQSQSQ